MNQLSPIAQAELETGTATQPPKLNGAEDFNSWKTRIKSFFEYTDYTQWISVTVGPHVPTISRDDVYQVNTDPTTFTDEDRALIQRDRRAHAALTMALNKEDCNLFEEYTTAHDLWLALIDHYEGNEEMMEGKRDMIQKEHDMFGSIRGESLTDHINRFLKVLTKMKQVGNTVENYPAMKKLLDSLPKEWSLQCMMIKRTFLASTTPVTLSSLINTLKAFEMDVLKREMNQSSQPEKSAQVIMPKNMAFAAPTYSGTSSSQHVNSAQLSASANTAKAPEVNDKHIVVGMLRL